MNQNRLWGDVNDVNKDYPEPQELVSKYKHLSAKGPVDLKEAALCNIYEK